MSNSLVLSVSNTQTRGELEERAVGITIAQAATDAPRADIVAGRLQDNEERLDALTDRQETLHEQRAADVSVGTY